MYLVYVDFSVNSLLTEQLNVRSFYDLVILNSTLLKLQLEKFSSANIKKAFIINGENLSDFSLFEAVNINLSAFNKTLFSLDNSELVVLIRNDVYFEFDFSEYKDAFSTSGIYALENGDGFCFAVVSTVAYLKKIYSKNISFSELINNSQKFSDTRIKIEGYTKLLNTVKSYKCLLTDILNGKTLFKPPHIAEGVFTDCNVPKGDFSIIPPVYIGEGVQIESGSTIGPDVVIHKHCLISTDTSIKNSVLFDNVYISSNCFIDGVVCCENSSVKRNSAVFSGSVIGMDSLIGEDMLVENNSIIKKSVKFDKYVKSPLTNSYNHLFENRFQGLSPDKASILGSALATVFNKPKVIVASDGSPNSLSIKLALLSGLIASGAECFDVGNTFKAHIFFCLQFCECDYSIFISGKSGGTDVEIFNSSNLTLSRADCCNIFDFCNKGRFVFVKSEDCKAVRQIHGLRKMYIREITSEFGDYLDFTPIINCKNEILSKTLGDIFEKTGDYKNNGEKIYINMNETGTNVNIKYNDKIYNQNTLQKLVHFYKKKDEYIKAHKNKYYENLWKKDSIFLLFRVFDIIKKSDKNIEQLLLELPDFFICSKSFEKKLKTGEMSENLGAFGKVFYKNGGFNLPLKNGYARILNKPFSDKIKILCASENFSVSEELCGFICDILKIYDA